MGWVCVSVGSIQCVCGHMVSGHGVGLCECREYTMCLWTHGKWTWGWGCVSVGSIQCVCGHMASGHGVGLCERREYTMCLWTHGEWTWGGFV